MYTLGYILILEISVILILKCTSFAGVLIFVWRCFNFCLQRFLFSFFRGFRSPFSTSGLRRPINNRTGESLINNGLPKMTSHKPEPELTPKIAWRHFGMPKSCHGICLLQKRYLLLKKFILETNLEISRLLFNAQ